MTASLEEGEWSAARPGRTLPPGKTRYPLYRRLGGPQGRSGRAENLVPTGIRSRTVQPIAQSLYRLSYPAYNIEEYQDYFLVGLWRPVRTADNLTTIMCRLPWNLRALASWNPQGLSRPVMGLLYLYLTNINYKVSSRMGYNSLSFRSQLAFEGACGLILQK